MILKGPKGWANLNTKDTNVWEGDYQMVGRQGRGKADLMKQRGENRYTILDNGSFTSCLPGSDTWSVVGSEIIHDREEQVAEIWNARFKVGPVPIFYSPYLQLPVGDKRRSGFLIPNAKYTYSTTLSSTFHITGTSRQIWMPPSRRIICIVVAISCGRTNSATSPRRALA